MMSKQQMYLYDNNQGNKNIVIRNDYKTYQRDFDELQKLNPQLSVREFCSKAGLNYVSARRYIKKSKLESNHLLASNSFKKPRKRLNWPALLREFLITSIRNPELSMQNFSDSKRIPYPSVRRSFGELKKAHETQALWELRDRQRKLLTAFKRGSISLIIFESEREYALQELEEEINLNTGGYQVDDVI